MKRLFYMRPDFGKKTLTLVTYNGKSFDVPQLETRWTMNRKTLPPLLTHAPYRLTTRIQKNLERGSCYI